MHRLSGVIIQKFRSIPVSRILGIPWIYEKPYCIAHCTFSYRYLIFFKDSEHVSGRYPVSRQISSGIQLNYYLKVIISSYVKARATHLECKVGKGTSSFFFQVTPNYINY
jgi:hypothetical protein